MSVSRDGFLVAGDGWARCRAGEADPSRFGIFKGDRRGLVREAAALARAVLSRPEAARAHTLMEPAPTIPS